MEQENSTGSLWRRPKVLSETGLSDTELYRRLKRGAFPKPIKLGARAVAWPSQAVQAWIKAMIDGTAK